MRGDSSGPNARPPLPAALVAGNLDSQRPTRSPPKS